MIETCLWQIREEKSPTSQGTAKQEERGKSHIGKKDLEKRENGIY